MNELAVIFNTAASRFKIDIQFSSMGSMFGFFFHPGPVTTKLEVDNCDFQRFKRFFVGMLERGSILLHHNMKLDFCRRFTVVKN